MAYDNGYQYCTNRTRKPWRYPGVPIPFRLQHQYYDQTATRRK